MCASLHLLLGKTIENIFPAKINTFVIKFPIFFSLPTLVITALHKHHSYKFPQFCWVSLPSRLHSNRETYTHKFISPLGPGSIRARERAFISLPFITLKLTV